MLPPEHHSTMPSKFDNEDMLKAIFRASSHQALMDMLSHKRTQRCLRIAAKARGVSMIELKAQIEKQVCTVHVTGQLVRVDACTMLVRYACWSGWVCCAVLYRPWR